MSYWGITDGNSVVLDSDRKQYAVFATGIFDVGGKVIVSKAPFELPKEGKKLCFDLLLSLPLSYDNYIVFRKNINIKYSYDNGIYLFEGEGMPSVISCYEIDELADLTPFFDYLHDHLINNIKFYK